MAYCLRMSWCMNEPVMNGLLFENVAVYEPVMDGLLFENVAVFEPVMGQ